VLLAAAFVTSVTSATPADWGFVGANTVASSPVEGGGYPVPAGRTKPDPGTCRLGDYNSNRSESWLAVKPGTEDLVGTSKFFFETYSTFYMFHLGSYRILGGSPVDNNQVQGYDCISTGTQEMPPSWTDNTDPNADFDTQGRVYQTTLPFNAFWEGGLHPNAEIDISYSDDMGQHWVRGNGGKPLEPTNNQLSTAFGHVEDKQWIAVNHIEGNPNQDHVYAAWAVFNGSAIKVRMAVSRDRGQTFAKALTIATPSQVSSAVTYVYPAVDAAGDVYVAIVSFPPSGKRSHIFVARSDDDGRSFGPWVSVATPGIIPTPGLPNTRFRDGITEHFAASPTHPGHVYVTYEDWDGTDMDVKLTQSIDGGETWSQPETVNDNVDSAGTPTDQFQPSVAAGPDGAVAVAFYDRRRACPDDPSILPEDVGRTNFCIDTTLQAYKDTGTGAEAVGGNVRISEFAWDPEQPGQKVDGISQYACAGHRDPCPNGTGFIGDYFGLAISEGNVYSLFVSTHYPSAVTSDEGGPVYYQQQVLAKVPRSTFGAGY
jgi:hypothetical protein